VALALARGLRGVGSVCRGASCSDDGNGRAVIKRLGAKLRSDNAFALTSSAPARALAVKGVLAILGPLVPRRYRTVPAETVSEAPELSPSFVCAL
jgi:hypothetical protein